MPMTKDVDFVTVFVQLCDYITCAGSLRGLALMGRSWVLF